MILARAEGPLLLLFFFLRQFFFPVFLRRGAWDFRFFDVSLGYQEIVDEGKKSIFEVAVLLRISQTHIEYFLENFDSLIVELFIDARLDLDRWWLRNLIKLDILKFAFQDLVKYLEIIIGLLDLQCWQNHLLPARGIQSNVDLNIVLDI